MNESFFTRLKNYEVTFKGTTILVIGILLILSFVFLYIRTGKTGDDKLQGSTDSTVKEVKQELGNVRQEIRDARDSNGFAQDTLERVGDRVERSESIAIENNQRIAEIERLIRECREINNCTRRTLQTIGE